MLLYLWSNIAVFISLRLPVSLVFRRTFTRLSPLDPLLRSYNFCYEIAQTFLDTFETYSNFDLKSGGAFSSIIIDDEVVDLEDLSPPSSPSVDTVVPPRAETFI